MNRTIQYRRFGGPEVLDLVEQPTPKPGPGQVRVRVQAVGLNPVDAKSFAGLLPLRVGEAVHRLRSGSRGPRFPRGVAKDFAGVVEAVGDDVTAVAVGQDVLGTLRSSPFEGATWGSLTDQLVVAVDSLVPRPTTVPLVVAASLGVAAETASGALRALKIDADDVLAISGASGGVGSLAAQLAVHHGVRVLGIAGPGSSDYLHSLGVVPISYAGDVKAQLREVSGGTVTKFLDCYGGPYVAIARQAGVPRGSVATLVPSPATLLRGARFTGSRDAKPGDLRTVTELVAAGMVRTRIDRRIPFTLESVRAAYSDLLTGHTTGKVIVELT